MKKDFAIDLTATVFAAAVVIFVMSFFFIVDPVRVPILMVITGLLLMAFSFVVFIAGIQALISYFT